MGCGWLFASHWVLAGWPSRGWLAYPWLVLPVLLTYCCWPAVWPSRGVLQKLDLSNFCLHQLVSEQVLILGRYMSFVCKSFVIYPANDHGFIYNDQGKVDIIKSPFFDFSPEVDQSVEEYVDRIVFQLAASIDEQLSYVQWLVDGNTKKFTNVKNLPMPTSSSGDEVFQVEEN
ncbi:hypothetical protein M5K25_009577 [Dendrobium thyrsiflorum]|uniref:Uncharacterized protein n=1 Tax=Dendrobium thyrsiflorum TaxID=117978 RepID=A0ABD0V655_DENTH